MTGKPKIPVIFLAFANDHRDYLYKLTEEQDGIRKALKRAEKNGLCEVVYETDTDLDKIFRTFDEYQDRIAIFHYGGHATDFSLLLKTASGERQQARSEGLMAFLAQQKGLQLVFINGCCSKQQAEALRDQGVPLVIGTAQPIDDQAATLLSSRFYESLAAGRTIDQAWKAAQAKVKAEPDAGSGYRAIGSVEAQPDEQRISFPWDAYYRPGAALVKEWSLPKAAKNPLFDLHLPEETYYRADKLPETPFIGLQYFTEKQAAIFFGRGAQIREINDAIININPIILFHGKSGVGKSSLLYAGLIPRIQDRFTVKYVRRNQELGLLGSLDAGLSGASAGSGQDADKAADQRDTDLQQLENILANIKSAIVRAEIESLIRNLREMPVQPVRDLPDILKKWKALEDADGKPLLVILDQVEEKFTRPVPGAGKGKDELLVFLETIKPLFAGSESGIRGRLVLSFRKEFFTEIRKAFQNLSLPFSEVFLERLDRDGIVEAVAGLTQNPHTRKHYRLEIEDQLPEIIADDLQEDRESPIAPVLQIILKKLWLSADKKPGEAVSFTIDRYQALRKEGTTMSEFFHQQMEKLADRHKAAVDSGLALDLLFAHTTAMGTAGSCHQKDLLARYNIDAPQMLSLLQELQDLSLLIAIESANDGSDEQKSENTYILAHDTLAPAVIREYTQSDKPGQRAARIINSNIGQVGFTVSENIRILFEADGIPETVIHSLGYEFIGQDRFLYKINEILGPEKIVRHLPAILESAKLNFNPGNKEIRIEKHNLEIVEEGLSGMHRLNRAESMLVEISRERREKLQKQRKRLQIAFISMMLLIVLGGAVAVWFWQAAEREKNNVRHQLKISESQKLAAEAKDFIDQWGEVYKRAPRKTLAALETYPTAEAIDALQAVVFQHIQPNWPSLTHSGCETARWVNAGENILTISPDSAILWNLQGEREQIVSPEDVEKLFPKNAFPETDLIVSPDRAIVVLPDNEGEINLGPSAALLRENANDFQSSKAKWNGQNSRFLVTTGNWIGIWNRDGAIEAEFTSGQYIHQAVWSNTGLKILIHSAQERIHILELSDVKNNGDKAPVVLVVLPEPALDTVIKWSHDDRQVFFQFNDTVTIYPAERNAYIEIVEAFIEE